MNTTGAGKIIGGCVCVAIWFNGAVGSATLGEVAVGAFAWLGGAGALFYLAWKERKEAKAAAFKNISFDLGSGSVKITDLNKNKNLPA